MMPNNSRDLGIVVDVRQDSLTDRGMILHRAALV
jgi:hypothetical protein